MVEAGHNELKRTDECSGIPILKWPEIEKAQFLYAGIVDDLVVDSLLLLFDDNRPAVAADADMSGLLSVRYDPETGDVIGVEIEVFERYFLTMLRPDFAAGWEALKPEGDDGFHNSEWLSSDVALEYAHRLKDLAHQGTLAPGWPF